MPSDHPIETVFSEDLDASTALTICEKYARTLIAQHDEDGNVPERDQEIFIAMLAETFDYEATRRYLDTHKHGPIVEWMTRFPDALEQMLERFVRR